MITVTANLLAETTAYYAPWERGQTRRALRESFQVGGKGINVARMAARLSAPEQIIAVCFPAGYTGARCQSWLEAFPFAIKAFGQPGETRSGWVVRQDESDEETTFLGQDRPLDPLAWEACLLWLLQQPPGQQIAFCGSIPGWGTELRNVTERYLEKLAEMHFLALDTYGPPLADLVKMPFHLIKINRDELLTLFPGTSDQTDTPALLSQAQATCVRPPDWLVTNGAEAACLLTADGTLHELTPPAVATLSPTGCGDVTLAAWLCGLAQGSDTLSAAAEALRHGSANAASAGIADYSLNAVSQLPQTIIKPLSSGR